MTPVETKHWRILPNGEIQLGNVCVGQVTACHLKGVPPYQACVLAPKHWAYGDTPLEAARAAVRLACDMWAGVEEDPGDDLAVAA